MVVVETLLAGDLSVFYRCLCLDSIFFSSNRIFKFRIYKEVLLNETTPVIQFSLVFLLDSLLDVPALLFPITLGWKSETNTSNIPLVGGS